MIGFRRHHQSLKTWESHLIQWNIWIPQNIKDWIYEHIPEGQRTVFARTAIIHFVEELRESDERRDHKL